MINVGAEKFFFMDMEMSTNHRARLSYYKQIYRFGYLISKLADPSWLSSISVPSKIRKNQNTLDSFLSQQLLKNARPFTRTSNEEQSVLLFIASLPKEKLNRYLNYLVLAYLKNDKSLLINGIKLKAMRQFFSTEEMEFLTHEKQVKIHLSEKLNVGRHVEFDEYYRSQIGFSILSNFFPNKKSAIYERLKMRFPKEFSLPENLTLFINTNANIQVITIIAQALFPDIYSIFQLEEEIPASASVTRNENAYQVTSVNEP